MHSSDLSVCGTGRQVSTQDSLNLCRTRTPNSATAQSRKTVTDSNCNF